MTLRPSDSYDLTAVEQFLSNNSNLAASTASLPDQVAIAGEETSGMSFSELFSHYLAPEVAKLPNSTSTTNLLPGFPDASFTFGAVGGGASANSNAEFDPSTFMPSHVPGSPISPSETGSLSHSAASPMSFADFDDMFQHNAQIDPSPNPGDAFAVDPSIFDQLPTSFSPSGQQPVAGIALPSLEQSTTSPFSSASALPPLPDLAPLSTFDLALPPPPAHSSFASHQSQIAHPSGRPKRNVSSMIVQEEEEEEEEALEQDDEEEDEGSAMSDNSTMTTTRRRSSRPPSNKKTRSNSSSTSSANASKKLPKTSVAALASEGLYMTSSKSNLPPVPLWKDKPAEEEYKKLSSKEKRQLRNKISARNFRHRRKEYITTLEEEISTRDNLITNLQDQVSTLKTDNSSLKSEVTLLKTKWQELLDKMSSLAGTVPATATPSSLGVGLGVNPSKAIAVGVTGQAQVKEEEPWELDSPASSASPLPSSSDASATRRTRSSNGIQRPNLTKDLPPRRSNSSWNPQGFGGGFQSVHTTLVPDFSTLASHLSNKAPFLPGQSFNPNLNNLTPDQLNELPSLTSHLRPASLAPPNPNASAFEDLFSTNPFYLNHASLESQRAGLYSRIAHNTAGIAQAKKQQQQQSSPPEGQLALPTGFRPAFFSGSSIPTKSTEKALVASSTTTRELLAFQSPASAAPASHQDAYQLKLAQLASETLFSKMTGAFFRAFSGSSSSSPSAPWDSDKVKDVISGRATLQVVPVGAVEPPRTHHRGVAGLDDALEQRMASLDLDSSKSSSSSNPSSSRGTRSLSPSRVGPTTPSCSFDEVVNRWTVKSEGPSK